MPEITATVPNGVEVALECEGTISSAWVAKDVLSGTTYPHVPFVEDVRVIVDAGANIGATSVYLATLYPDARVHAIEPALAPRALLERNVADHDVVVHAIGLSDEDASLPLYGGREGASIMGSLHKRPWNSDDYEMVEIRSAAAWAAEQGIDRIDVLKVDVEGSEAEVLRGLEALLPTTKLVYVEYGSRQLRREVFSLLERHHEYFMGAMMLDQGECVFLRSDLCDSPAVEEFQAARLRAAFGR